MVGEHGDSSVAIWSSISVGGMPAFKSLRDSHHSFNEAALEGIRRAVVGGAYEVIGLKGYTSWAIGYSVASLAASLLRDQRRVHPVSVLAAGFHGISDSHQVFLSLPARLGRGGVVGVAEMDLTEAEAGRRNGGGTFGRCSRSWGRRRFAALGGNAAGGHWPCAARRAHRRRHGGGAVVASADY